MQQKVRYETRPPADTCPPSPPTTKTFECCDIQESEQEDVKTTMPLPTLQPLALAECLAAVVWLPVARSLSDMSLITLPPPSLLLLPLLLPFLEPASAAPALAGVCQDSMTEGVAATKCYIFFMIEDNDKVKLLRRGFGAGMHAYRSRHCTQRIAAIVIRYVLRRKEV
jgi:hypothetical protein